MTINRKNTEYRIVPVIGGYEVWLINTASGAKLSKVSGSVIFKSEFSAQEHLNWVKEQELKYIQ